LPPKKQVIALAVLGNRENRGKIPVPGKGDAVDGMVGWIMSEFGAGGTIARRLKF
jgi:hypothetical protein